MSTMMVALPFARAVGCDTLDRSVAVRREFGIVVQLGQCRESIGMYFDSSVIRLSWGWAIGSIRPVCALLFTTSLCDCLVRGPKA